jgi:hypothetical protein
MPFDGVPSNPIAEILLYAEIKLLTSAWAWRNWWSEADKHECMITLLKRATSEKGFSPAEYVITIGLVAEAIGLRKYKRFETTVTHIIYWNDRKAQTVRDVTRVLREAQRLAYRDMNNSPLRAAVVQLELELA